MAAPTSNFVIVGLPLLRLTGAYDSAMGVTNLATVEPSEKWRSAGLSPEELTATLVNGDPTYVGYVSGIGLVGHSGRLTGSGTIQPRVRVVGSENSPAVIYPTVEALTPSAIDTRVGVTGDLADIQGDPYNGDASYITIAAAGYILLDFPTPAAPLVRGTTISAVPVKAHVFTIFAVGGIGVQLYEAGSALGSPTLLPPSIGFLQEVVWDGGLLADPTGADLQVRIWPYTGTCKLYDVRAYVETDQSDGNDNYDFDTGWVDIDGSQKKSDFDPVTAKTVVLYSDPDAVIQPSDYFTVRVLNGGNADGFFEAGVLVIGQAWQADTNTSYGEILSWWDSSFKGFTHGGQTYGSRRPTLWKPKLSLDTMTHTEGAYFVQQLKDRGVLMPVLISITPEDADLKDVTTVWCTVDSAENSLAADYLNNVKAEISFVEKK